MAWQGKLRTQEFIWSKFLFHIKAINNIYLPQYKGSALRGGFGYSFRKVSCTIQQQECIDCLLKQSCPYAYVFETPNNENINVNHQADNLPHPFVIEPPQQEKKEYLPGESLYFSLILFGKGISFLPYFIYAFDHLGDIGLGRGKEKFELEKVTAINDFYPEMNKTNYNNQSMIISGDFKTWDFKDVASFCSNSNLNRIQINILTPLRISVRSKLIDKLTFELFLRNLLRRISLLGKIHCQGEWNLPYKEIIEQAKEKVELVEDNTKWTNWERY